MPIDITTLLTAIAAIFVAPIFFALFSLRKAEMIELLERLSLATMKITSNRGRQELSLQQKYGDNYRAHTY
jgi:hypothetical protein